MGVFRLLLAATVMLGHFHAFYPSPLPYLMNGTASVPAFYIVSGFLITLVLQEKYGSRLALFYSNRALRIFPLYWASLIIFLTANWLVVHGHLSQENPTSSALWWADKHSSEVGFVGTSLLWLSNVFIVGQDFMLFIGKWPHLLSPDYFYHRFMYVGPAWSIAIELCFYAIAPFIVRGKSIWVVAALVASLLARSIVVWLGHAEFIESYNFPPFELAFFMAGSLAYRGYTHLRESTSALVTIYGILSSITIILLTVFYLYLPLARPLYLIAASLCLPGIVLVGPRIPFDRICGELSYPIYLLHPVFTVFIFPGNTVSAEIVAIALTVTLSLGLVYFIERPIEALRRRRSTSGIANRAEPKNQYLPYPQSASNSESP